MLSNGARAVPLPEPSRGLGHCEENELKEGPPDPGSCSTECPGQGKDTSRSHLTWKELRKREKNTLT